MVLARRFLYPILFLGFFTVGVSCTNGEGVSRAPGTNEPSLPSPGDNREKSDCVPRDCEVGQCGVIDDGCGGQLDCGGCQYPEVCGAGELADRCEPCAWDSETVFDDPVEEAGQFTSLAFDESGSPWVTYYNFSSEAVVLASQQGGVWKNEELASPVRGSPLFGVLTGSAFHGGKHHAVAAHFIHSNESISLLHLGHDMPVGTLPSEPQTVEVKVDGTGVMHLFSNSFGKSIYGKWNQEFERWDTEANMGLGDKASVADWLVDDEGKLHVVFNSSEDFVTYYQVRTEGGWGEREPIAPEFNTLVHAGLALDSEGEPHLVHSIKASRALYYSHRGTDGWTREKISDDISNSLAGIETAVDKAGTIHVIHDGPFPFDTLAYVYRHVGGPWKQQLISEQGKAGAPRARLLRSPSGHLTVSYTQFTGRSVHLATQECTEE